MSVTGVGAQQRLPLLRPYQEAATHQNYSDGVLEPLLLRPYLAAQLSRYNRARYAGSLNGTSYGLVSRPVH
jgi:hypothetical protein